MDKTSNDVEIELDNDCLEILSYYKTKDTKHNDYIFPLLDNEAIYAKYKGYDRSQMKIEVIKKLEADISTKNVLVNRDLKWIALKAGIKKSITFHVARHSFAEIARSTDISVYNISKLLKHSSIGITEGYMQRDDSKATKQALSIIRDRIKKK